MSDASPGADADLSSGLERWGRPRQHPSFNAKSLVTNGETPTITGPATATMTATITITGFDGPLLG
jgi:hypothetical protein